mgnify:CR=1 FL=1
MSTNTQQGVDYYAPRNEKELADLQKRQKGFSEAIMKLQERFKIVVAPMLDNSNYGIQPVLVLKNTKAYTPLPTKTGETAPILKPVTKKK